MSIRLSILAIPFVILCAPGAAVAGLASAAQDAAAAKPVCKRTMRTGTRFATQVCRTSAQWEAIAEANRRAAKEMVDRPAIKICGPQGGCD